MKIMIINIEEVRPRFWTKSVVDLKQFLRRTSALIQLELLKETLCL
jgi:hypothetical protein